MLFINKQKKIESELAGYNTQIDVCMNKFKKAFTELAKDGNRSTLQQNFLEIHHAESKADDIRREIEVMMYSKALFPESRGDILVLLETMDAIPNQAESAVRMVLNQHINIPSDLWPGILEMVELSHRCIATLLEAVGKLFTHFTNAAVAVGKVDELESAIDNIEQNLIEKIFSSDMDGTEKILLRDAINHIANISDNAENVGDRIRIIVAKRSV